MLYLIGLGINDEKDISLKAVEAIKNCDNVYCEKYTNLYHGNLGNLETLTNKKIFVLTRSEVEELCFLSETKGEEYEKNTALLVPGDPLTATTHITVLLEAEKRKIKTKVIHASSIYSAVAETGLQIYKFGRSTTIPFPYKDTIPESPYNVIKENQERNLHTLVLLDIDAENKKYMTVKEGIQNLIEIENKKKENLIKNLVCVGCSRLGSDESIIKAGRFYEVKEVDFGAPPHCLIIPGKLHFAEEEALLRFLIK